MKEENIQQVKVIIKKSNDDLTSILKSGVDKSETSRRAYADIDENVPMEELFLSDDKTINKRVLQDEEIEEIKDK